MKNIFLFILFFFSSHLLAQKQGNIWYFGEGAGMDFNSGTPVALSGGQLFGRPQADIEYFRVEGSATISDTDGNLLFYTDGELVWNRENNVMPGGGGLMGMYSSTTPAFIVPVPLSDSLFYIFTTDGIERDLEDGFRYTMVDMCLDDGLGGIVPGQKNILLFERACEKITAVNHPNGRDIWVITHQHNSDAFYAYLVTDTGIAPPVISNTGFVHQGTNFYSGIGQMKASPNGEKIALVVANINPEILELLDFDKATGMVSNPIRLSTTDIASYGVEFSPDNSKLYFTGSNGVYQYDLEAGGGDATAIINSRILISYGVTCSLRGIQLGPDDKIYVRGCLGNIDIIQNPNQKGLACNFDLGAGPTVSGGSFPSFIPNYEYRNGLTGCVLETERKALCGDGIDNDNDGKTDCEDEDCIFFTDEVKVLCQDSYKGYSQSGIYRDTLAAKSGCDSIITLDLTLKQNTIRQQQYTICEGERYLGYSTTGVYRDTFPNPGDCDIIQILDLTVITTPQTQVQQTICEGMSFMGFTETGVYADTFQTAEGCDSIFTLILLVESSITTQESISICDGDTYKGYSTSGIYADTFPVSSNCDSIHQINLLVNENQFTQIPVTICSGASYHGYTLAGTYLDTFLTSNGCDSIRRLALVVEENQNMQQDITICSSENYQGYTQSGIYVDTFTTNTGCDSINILELTVIEEQLTQISQTICDDEYFEGYNQTGIYADTFTLNSGCDSIRLLTLTVDSQIVQRETIIIQEGEIYSGYTESGIYTDTLSSNNCGSINQLELIVAAVYIPNIFSPNGDGVNDQFTIYTRHSDIQINTFQIFSRWGELVYAENNPTGISSWNGIYRGKELDVGVYVYYIELTYAGQPMTFKGDLTLVR